MVLGGMGVVSIHPVFQILRGVIQDFIFRRMDRNSRGRMMADLEQSSVRFLTIELED